MSTIYPPNELEIQALHREEIKGEAATKTLFRLYCTLSQSLYSSYRGIDGSWPPLPGLERQEFGAFCRKGFADNLKKKKPGVSAEVFYRNRNKRATLGLITSRGSTVQFEGSHL